MRKILLHSLLAAAIPFGRVGAQDNPPAKQFTNDIGMEFVWIPPGAFLMGSPKNEADRSSDEFQHKVKLSKGLYLATCVVTQAQWKKVMGSNPSWFKGDPNLPVESVSWTDCQKFLTKIRKLHNKPYRLPTEAEWEYACRAGTATPYCFGKTLTTDQANYNGSNVFVAGKEGVFREKTTTVGHFPANAWGLRDVHGNVMQWCQDWYGDYPQMDVVDPKGPEKGERRVVRGGSYFHGPSRSASRFSVFPDARTGNSGLRVCFFPN
jgi:formylglycine-generating enzyme